MSCSAGVAVRAAIPAEPGTYWITLIKDSHMSGFAIRICFVGLAVTILFVAGCATDSASSSGNSPFQSGCGPGCSH